MYQVPFQVLGEAWEYRGEHDKDFKPHRVYDGGDG